MAPNYAALISFRALVGFGIGGASAHPHLVPDPALPRARWSVSEVRCSRPAQARDAVAPVPGLGRCRSDA